MLRSSGVVRLGGYSLGLLLRLLRLQPLRRLVLLLRRLKLRLLRGLVEARLRLPTELLGRGSYRRRLAIVGHLCGWAVELDGGETRRFFLL